MPLIRFFMGLCLLATPYFDAICPSGAGVLAHEP